MRKIRYTIRWLMMVVVVLAVVCAALRNDVLTWAGMMLLLTCGVLVLAVVGAVVRRGARRAGWLGFALFGCGYMRLAFWPSELLPKLPTLLPFVAVLKWIAPRRSLSLQNFSYGGLGHGISGAINSSSPPGGLLDSLMVISEIGHCLWALGFALLGGLLARVLFGAAVDREARPDADRDPDTPSSRRPAVVGVVGLALLLVMSRGGPRSAPWIWTGPALLLTWSLLGVAALGAILGQGRRRAIWLGAALFGAGYMFLAFGSADPYPGAWLPTNPLVYALFGGNPRVTSKSDGASPNVAAANERILAALDRPLRMRSPPPTSLGDVLEAINYATRTPDRRGISIYVDPLGLQEAERSLNSVVAIDGEGVPLATSLASALQPIGLVYFVKDGALVITSDETEAPPVFPFETTGHCVFALIAAGLGGVLAPFVSESRRERPGSVEIRGAVGAGRASRDDEP